jgi:hypothetical protein
MKEINLWCIRNFTLLTNEEAKQLGLRHYMNFKAPTHHLYKSAWKDSKGRKYFGIEFV